VTNWVRLRQKLAGRVVYGLEESRRGRIAMDGSAPDRDEWEQDADWDRAAQREFPLLPVVVGIAVLLLLLVIFRPA
jgi:hypothetical protein